MIVVLYTTWVTAYVLGDIRETATRIRARRMLRPGLAANVDSQTILRPRQAGCPTSGPL